MYWAQRLGKPGSLETTCIRWLAVDKWWFIGRTSNDPCRIFEFEHWRISWILKSYSIISAPEQVAMSIAMVVLRPAMVVRFAKFQVGQSTPKMSDIARFQYLKIECPWVFLSGIYPKGPSQKHVKTLYMYDIYIYMGEWTSILSAILVFRGW